MVLTEWGQGFILGLLLGGAVVFVLLVLSVILVLAASNELRGDDDEGD